MRYDYAYDAAGRLKTKRASGVSLLSYEYDLNGNRIGMTDVTGKHTAYRYNSLNQLEEITDSGRSLARYSYNADGTIKRLEVGNSLVTEYGYDADRNITSQKTVMTGMPEHGIKGLPAIPKTGMDPVTMVDNTYTYDGNANRITKNTLSGKTGFGYDSANRLVRADYPQFSEEYRYDRAGNRMSRNRTGKGNAERREETYSYDACNRLTVHDITGFRNDGTQENIRRLYTYDMQGNMLSDGDRQYSYDVRNRLAEVRTADGSWQKNHYDGEGLRAELEENGRLVRFIYDGDKAVLEGTDENTIRHIRGYELVSSDSEAAKTYYHYASDELGSITHVTDEDGNVLNRYEYDAFGNFTLKEETVENRFGFAGEQYDPAANLYYLRARFYNPVIGRFIQEDTYYGDGLNLYTYCHNNPVGYVDPSGHEGSCPWKQTAMSKLEEAGIQNATEVYENLKQECNGNLNEVIKKINEEYVNFGTRYDNASDITRSMRENKPKNSRNIEKWYKLGGTISIDENNVWTYHDRNGNSVRYINGFADFLGAGLVDDYVDLGGFVDRNYDFAEARRRGKIIADENTWHHSHDGRTLQSVNTELHKLFTHRGGISLLTSWLSQ